jgi:hypothetical protein
MFMTDDQKVDCMNEIQNMIRELLQDCKQQLSVTCLMTSIYDHSIYEALSKVV